MNKTLFDDLDISYWHNSEYAQKYYVGITPTNEQVEEVENELGYKLPQSYIALIKQQNGGMPINTCFPTSVPTCWAENHIAISGIMGIDKNKPYSLCGEMGNSFWIEEWGYPAIGIAICTTPTASHRARMVSASSHSHALGRASTSRKERSSRSTHCPPEPRRSP